MSQCVLGQDQKPYYWYYNNNTHRHELKPFEHNSTTNAWFYQEYDPESDTHIPTTSQSGEYQKYYNGDNYTLVRKFYKQLKNFDKSQVPHTNYAEQFREYNENGQHNPHTAEKAAATVIPYQALSV